MAKTLIRVGKVELIETPYTPDGADGLRIKARLPQDGILPIEDIDWAFPLLPKTLQTVPQVGEGVLIITAELDNSKSQRYYIGPVIPQPQYMEYAPNEANYDFATSLLQGHTQKPLGKISNNDLTTGAFPKHNDVAVIGRGKEDIRLKYDSKTDTSEIDITAGIRQKPHNNDNDDIVGNVIFNNSNPAYIQVKNGKELSNQGESFINIVGDKINLMSHNDTEINSNLVDNKNLINETNFDQVMSKLHPAVKGDKLLELLNLMIGVIKNHVHPWSGMEQCGDWKGYTRELDKFDVNSILSEDIKIS